MQIMQNNVRFKIAIIKYKEKGCKVNAKWYNLFLKAVTKNWKKWGALVSKKNVQVSDYLRDKLIFLHTNFKNSHELFKGVNEVAKQNGYVTEDFLPKIIKRESTFPTGLQLEKCGVAIPHTDADTIRKEFVSVIVNESPIRFKRMDDPTQEVDDKLVFVLGLNRPHAQLEMLQALMSIIQDASLVDKLEHANTNADIYDLLGN